MTLDEKIRAAFASNPKIHSVSFGVCTAHKTPGNFAMFRDAKGDVIACVENADGLAALHRLCEDALQPRAPKVDVKPLPIMQTRGLPI